jgi:glycosyltransferase involved in cell wall biosynthesis
MRVLLITYHFPPDGEIGGVRPFQIARHLPEFGVEPWVLTVEPQFAESFNAGLQAYGVPQERIVRTPVNRTVHDRVLHLWRRLKPAAGSAGAGRLTRSPGAGGVRGWALSWISYPDPRIGWYRPALRAAEELLRRVDFDALISTSPPRVAALVARDLSRRHRLPWVMDLRDPWVDWAPDGIGAKSTQVLLGRLFRSCAARADLIVHNTERMRLLTGRLVPESAGKTLSIPNGCDPRWQVQENAFPTAFSIGYHGQVMGRRSPEAFLAGLRLWLDSSRPDPSRIVVRFVGTGFDRITPQVEALGLGQMVKIFLPVPREEVVGLMARDYVLLLLANSQPVQVPGKTYEYLATGRRILALTEHDGATADLLGPLDGCVVAERVDEVASALDLFYGDYKRGASPRIDRAALLEEAQYVHRVERFASALRNITRTAPTPRS